MSGQELRDASIKGYSDVLKKLLAAQSNPCSRDKMSLCSLHYAAWNGHVECVKLLISNCHGVDSAGNRASALQFKSCLGYNALHLAALDSPKYTLYDVTTLLLLAGLDQTAVAKDGKTPLQLAEEFGRSEFLQALADFQAAENDDEVGEAHRVRLGDIKNSLLKNYCVQKIREPTVSVGLEDAGFELPDFLLNYKKSAPCPPGLAIHEEHIKPLIKEGFFEMNGLETYACLHFSQDQALINKARREKLVKADPTIEKDKKDQRKTMNNLDIDAS